MLLVYAIVDGRARPAGKRGGFRETLRTVKAGRVAAIVGDIESAPETTPERLEAHDAAVRRLAAVAPAILPVRFATMFDGEDELRERLSAGEKPLREALALVDGREQMNLRIFRKAPAAVATALARAGHSSSGTMFLEERKRISGVHELDPVRPLLAPLLRGERVQRSATPPLLASAYHLIDRGAARRYLAAVKRAGPRAVGMRLQATGPFPPYAFAPEVPW